MIVAVLLLISVVLLVFFALQQTPKQFIELCFENWEIRITDTVIGSIIIRVNIAFTSGIFVSCFQKHFKIHKLVLHDREKN